MALEFKNPEVAKGFVAKTDKDIMKVCGAYHGMLSKVTPAGAEYMVKCGDPHIARKAATAANSGS